jgi:hypothetical protein
MSDRFPSTVQSDVLQFRMEDYEDAIQVNRVSQHTGYWRELQDARDALMEGDRVLAAKNLLWVLNKASDADKEHPETAEMLRVIGGVTDQIQRRLREQAGSTKHPVPFVSSILPAFQAEIDLSDTSNNRKVLTVTF